MEGVGNVVGGNRGGEEGRGGGRRRMEGDGEGVGRGGYFSSKRFCSILVFGRFRFSI